MNGTIERTDLVQQSPEWYQARFGKISSSNVGRIMSSYIETSYYADNKVNQNKGIAGNIKHQGGFNAGAITYALEIIAEELLQEPIKGDFSTYAMDWGNEHEPSGRELYHNNIAEVRELGGFENGILWFSPDGIVGDDGLIENKCPQIVQHLRNFMSTAETLDPKYIDQMQFGMMITGRKWCDFISFHPYAPDEFKFKVIRINRDEEYITLMTDRIEQMKIQIINIKTKLGLI